MRGDRFIDSRYDVVSNIYIYIYIYIYTHRCFGLKSRVVTRSYMAWNWFRSPWEK